VITSARIVRVACAVLLGASLFAPAVLVCAPRVAAAVDNEPKPYALIFGTVWGADNRPIHGVPIKIRRADQKKAKWELLSDHRGEFAQRLPAGTADYIVWADVKVAKGKEKPQVLVHVENDERKDISLHLTE